MLDRHTPEFAPSSSLVLLQVCSMQMQGEGVSRRELFKSVAAFGLAAVPAIANADVDYPNLPYLGGGDQIDVNNANIRVYTKLPGMYPSIAGLIVKVFSLFSSSC